MYTNQVLPDHVRALESGVRVGQSMRQMMDKKEKREAYEEGVTQNPDGTKSFDQQKSLAALAAVDPDAHMEAQKNYQQLDANKFKMDQEKQYHQMDMIGRLALSSTDQASYDQNRAQAAKFGIDVSEMPAAWDKNLTQRYGFNAMSAKEKLGYDLQKQQMQEQRLDRQESRDERRYLHGVDRQDKLAAREEKKKELNATQAKQLGLYKLGAQAEEQYKKAVADKNEYDPTSVGQVIDNSNWAPNWLKNNNAVEARAAEANWVEAYLRDASGAAIPPSERQAYAKDFFPQPGDTSQVVANKEILRKQKMQNALIGAGAGAEERILAGGEGVQNYTPINKKQGLLSIEEANAKKTRTLKTNEIEWAD